MGCDIHIYAEKKNTKTNKWDRIGKKFIDNYAIYSIIRTISETMGIERDKTSVIVWKYINGEKPTNRIEEYIINDFIPSKISTEKEDLDQWDAQNVGKLPYLYTETPYGGRNYTLFNVLAGVRGDGEDQIDDLRGLPDDVNGEILSDYKYWDLDAHSSSHYYLDELLKSKYHTMSKDELHDINIDSFFFHEMLEEGLKMVEDPNDLRFVFWFDN